MERSIAIPRGKIVMIQVCLNKKGKISNFLTEGTRKEIKSKVEGNIQIKAETNEMVNLTKGFLILSF